MFFLQRSKLQRLPEKNAASCGEKKLKSTQLFAAAGCVTLWQQSCIEDTTLTSHKGSCDVDTHTAGQSDLV